MESHTTGEEIFRVTDMTDYLKENSLTWNSLFWPASVFAQMVRHAWRGEWKDLWLRWKAQNPHIVTNHCILHREALVAKTMLPELSEVLDQAVQMVNYIKSTPEISPLLPGVRRDGSRPPKPDPPHRGILAVTGESPIPSLWASGRAFRIFTWTRCPT